LERLVIITGLSGSGKSLAGKSLEDLGYWSVDNLPVALIPSFCELIQRGGEQTRRAALVVDIREGTFLEQFPEMLAGLREQRLPVQLLFFDCSDEVLKRRFSETRRPHPMVDKVETLEQAIEEERAALSPLRELADRLIDTSKFTSHELKAFLRNAYGIDAGTDGLKVNVSSFGFKYGIPSEADLLFDVRFLPNPFFVEELRPLDGRTREVQAFLEKQEVLAPFMERLQSFVSFLVPHYAAEGKTYLSVAIGCTGGKHRSVALTEKLGSYLAEQEFAVTVSHRDLGKE